MPVRVRDIPPSLLRGPSTLASSIQDAVYIAGRRELRITFASGRSYAYSDVPQSIYDAFLASPSKGAFFSIAIRGRFRFRELTQAASSTQH